MRSDQALKHLLGFLDDCLFTIHYHQMIRAERRFRHGRREGLFKHGSRGIFSAFKRHFGGVSESTADEAEDWVQKDEEIMEDIDQLLREFDE